MNLEEARKTPREGMDYDVVIVGAGPAGLAAAIKLKQLAASASQELSVVVVEKGAEVGAHILSGAVIDPIGIDRLLPEWRSEETPIKTKVTDDRFYYLGPGGRLRLPNMLMPPLMNNHGNFIVSLGNVCRWLGTKAEALGVEIYPGFAAAELLYGDKGEVVGIATGDMGIAKDVTAKSGFTRGMELRGKYVLFAEGARGSLTKELVSRFKLDGGPRPAEIRHRPQGAVAGRAREAQAGPRATYARLASRQSHGRRLLPLSHGGRARFARLRRPSELPQPDALAFRRVSALQDASLWCAIFSRAQSASAMAPAPSPRAAGNRCRSSPFRAAR